MRKITFLKAKISFLKLENDFIELKDRELKDRELEIKGEIEQKEMKKKNTWYDSLINYIPESTRKFVGGFKDKVVSLFKRNTTKAYGKEINHAWERKEIK